MKLKLIYNNPLASEKDVAGFRMEGDAQVFFEQGKMHMKNALDPALGQKSNFVFWCPEEFPENIVVDWEFTPVEEPGLAILFFCARGTGGQDLFDPSLATRDGQYDQYHSGDINAYHVSYFRRKWEEERGFHTCNLRKSKGFHLVVQGADPIPNVEDCQGPYRIRVVKWGRNITFLINDLEVFSWEDSDPAYGPVLGGGKIGFRQMAPLVGEYSNLKVYEIVGETNETGN